MNLRSIATGAALAALAAGPALANLVTNGGFESNGGNGQLGYNTSATDWSISGGYTFLFNAQGGTTSGTSADNSGANGQYGPLSLWGPGNGSANGLTLSPDGGAFIASDSAFQQAAVTQSINGLTPGDKYTVSFYWAAAQQPNFTGATYSQWEVSLGGQTQSTADTNIASQGFSGWMAQSFTYTATSSSELLSFYANGGPLYPSLPPFALLDGVSVNATVPEPATWAMMVLGFAGLGYAGYRSGRRRPIAIA